MSNRLNILGSGTSTGIPMLGCHCDVCTSTNPKNKRLRTSFLIETEGGKNILIDTTPDLRTQLLRANVDRIDAAIITHDHADHVHGIDDLRPFTFIPPRKSIPVFTDKVCAKALMHKFSYIFDKNFFNKDKPVLGGGIPKLHLEEVTPNGESTNICGEEFKFFHLNHGHGKTLAIIYKKLAILIDCNEVSREVRDAIKREGVDTIIIDCVTSLEHQTHLNVDAAFEVIKDLTPKRAGLIHMGHNLDHDELEKRCQESFESDVFPTYDTQLLTF